MAGEKHKFEARLELPQALLHPGDEDALLPQGCRMQLMEEVPAGCRPRMSYPTPLTEQARWAEAALTTGTGDDPG